MSLGVRLKQARQKKKLTQEELAEIVGIKQQAVQRIEAGKVRSTSYVVQLARALDVTPEWLALGEGDEASNGGVNSVDGGHNQAPLLQWDQIDEPLPISLGRSYPVYNGQGESCFALEIRDGSMNDPTPGHMSFLRDDVIIVRRTTHAQPGDFVLAKLADSSSATFRQYSQTEHGTELRALNPQYNTIPVDHSVKICGVVIARYSSLK